MNSLENKEEGKNWNQYNQVQHLTQGNEWESDKYTRKDHKQDSQEICPFPIRGHIAARKDITYGQDIYK